MLELQVREIGACLSGDEQTPVVAGALIVEGHHPWADSSFDLLHGLDVVELSAAALPVDPADLQAP